MIPAASGDPLSKLTMILGPTTGPMTSESLEEAYPWPAAPRWLRAMMVTTLNGAATGADGRSGSISSSTDKRVFAETRRLCDAILVGASTLRTERYRPVDPPPEHVAIRTSHGLADAPCLVVVSASLDLPWSEPVFSESAAGPMVVTVESANRRKLDKARQHADVVTLPGTRVDATRLVEVLAERELHRIVCEGGPQLLAQLARADLVDEADIAIAPWFAMSPQPAADPTRFQGSRLELVHCLEGEDFLFTRYVSTRSRVEQISWGEDAGCAISEGRGGSRRPS